MRMRIGCWLLVLAVFATPVLGADNQLTANRPFAVEGVKERQVVYFQRSDLKGRHYIFSLGGTACAVSSWALMRGGGCVGKDRLSWCSSSD